MILKGDALTMPIRDNSVDAIVCDPPYNLHFMGKDWDKDLLHEKWLTEAYRVLKPGGSMLVMGGTRTFHRLACAIEDSGFIIKDTLMWLYGSGFPKAQDLGKMIDKRNGVNIERAKELAVYVGRECEKKFSNEQLAKILGRKEKSCFIHHWTNGNYIPRIEELKKLGDLIEIPKRLKETWQLLEEEARREKIGIYIAPDGKDRGKYKGQFRHNWTGSIDPNITAPSTDLAKHWDGFKVGGIKPAYEPIIWAVKPPEGSYVDNVLKWGVGAVNVDECRIGTNANGGHWTHKRQGKITYSGKLGDGEDFGNTSPKGRFPANVILSHHPECVQVGVKRVKPHNGSGKSSGNTPKEKSMFGVESTAISYADKDGYEQVESWDCHPDCAVRLLDEQSGDIKSGGGKKGVRGGIFGNQQDNPDRLNSLYQDNGGASRFFYCAKASRGERNAGLEGMEEKAKATMEANKEGHFNQKCRICEKWKNSGSPCKCLNPDFYTPEDRPRAISTNNHPTVKPIKLFEYLIKLVTREGQIVLDPFIGSGTTAIAAHNTGRKCIGIEKEDEYLTIAKRRIDHWKNQPKQMEITL